MNLQTHLFLIKPDIPEMKRNNEQKQWTLFKESFCETRWSVFCSYKGQQRHLQAGQGAAGEARPCSDIKTLDYFIRLCFMINYVYKLHFLNEYSLDDESFCHKMALNILKSTGFLFC